MNRFSHRQERPAPYGRRASQCASAVVGGEPSGPTSLPSCPKQLRVTAGIAPCGSCLEQPTHTVTIGHGSPPFRVSDTGGRRYPPREPVLKAIPSRRGWPRRPLPTAGLLLPATPCRELPSRLQIRI